MRQEDSSGVACGLSAHLFAGWFSCSCIASTLFCIWQQQMTCLMWRGGLQAMLSWGLQSPFEALFSAYASQSGLGPWLPPPPVLRLSAAIGEPLAVADAVVCLLLRFDFSCLHVSRSTHTCNQPYTIWLSDVHRMLNCHLQDFVAGFVQNALGWGVHVVSLRLGIILPQEWLER